MWTKTYKMSTSCRKSSTWASVQEFDCCLHCWHCLYQLFGVAALAPRGLPPCRGFVREVPLAFPAPHLHAFGLWASMRYLVQVDR